MNRKWLQKWKKYVDYSFIKRKMIYQQQYLGRKLKPYIIDENLKPGPIDNSEILVSLDEFLNDGDLSDQSNFIIKPGIDQREEIKICGKKLWEFFFKKYGGGPEIIRPWITQGSSYSAQKIVEIFSRNLNILILPERRKISKENIYSLTTLSVFCSRNQNLADMKQRLVEIFENIRNKDIKKFKEGSILDLWLKKKSLTVNNIRLWKINSESNLDEFKEFLLKNLDDIINTDNQLNTEELLSYLEYIPNAFLKNLEFADTDVGIIEYFDDESPPIFEIKNIEIKEDKCDWCDNRKLLKIFCRCKEVGYCSTSCQDRGRSYHLIKCKRRFSFEEDTFNFTSNSRRGLTGLQNLGNTCFMNTSLQCLSNCYELTRYFIEDYYKEFINLENSIGTQGNLAKAYSNLLKNLWFGTSNIYSPWNFKSAIERFQSMFIGYQQHDTQEFLNYLLDGLHEDLNKVINKPIVIKDDSKKEDSVKAKEEWIGFLKRNQSFLVDLLYGQYKSILFCPDPNCQNVSTTFDPFLSLSLPLSSNTEKYEVKCFFIFYDINITPIHIVLNFFSETTVMSLRNKLSKLLNIHPFSFVIMKIDKNSEFDYFCNSGMLLKINSAKNLSKNEMAFFCLQINPSIFYNKAENKLSDLSEYSQIEGFENIYENMIKSKQEKKYLYDEDYEEDQKGQTKETICYYSKFEIMNNLKIKPVVLRVNTDNNYGLSNNYIMVRLNITKYNGTTSNLRSNYIFPRVIFLNKNWSTKHAHLIIANYFSPIFRDKYPFDYSNLWDSFFPDYEKSISNLTNLTHEDHMKKRYPYIIRIKSIFTEMGGHCIFCGKNICEDCLLPCREDVTIQNILDKIQKNHNMPIDNTYYYLNERQRNICPLKETDFVLESSWLKEYEDLVKILNIKQDFEIDETIGHRYQDKIDLNTCFKYFVKLEKLEEDNEWYCPECKKHTRADKKMEIYKTPHILIIHLKRFKNNRKLNILVDFPITNLDISKYVINKENDITLKYDLFAIANHNGSLSGGHYYAYAKNHFDNKWYCFNDSSVSLINEDELVTKSAYVMFYRRKDSNQILNLETLFKKPFENYEILDNKNFPSNSDSIRMLKINMNQMEM